MAGGGGQSAGDPQGGQKTATMPPNPQQMQQLQAMMAAGRGMAQGAPNAQMYNTRPMPMPQGYADGGAVGAGFMQYPYQGQPNQPNVLPPTQHMSGPDSGGAYPPANMGFDNSGSDGGVGGQPTMMQTPLSDTSGTANALAQPQGNKPLGIAQFMPQQGLQIAGNPTSQVVQRPQLR